MFTEYSLLRNALWDYLAELHGSRTALWAIAQNDRAITAATCASLTGHTRAKGVLSGCV